MTGVEFFKKLGELESQFHQQRYNLRREFVLSNTDVKIGDVVSDSGVTIKVEKIGVYVRSSGLPTAIFEGPRIKKNGEPLKSGERSSVFQGTLE